MTDQFLLANSIFLLFISFPLWSNDTCFEATEIEINLFPDYDELYNGDFSTYTLSSVDLQCNSWNPSNLRDVWYFFYAPQTKLVISVDVIAELYRSQDCGNLTFVDCIDSGGDISGEFIANERYYIRLIGFNNHNSFNLSVNIPPDGFHDTSCENAHLLENDVSPGHNFGGCLNHDPFNGDEDCSGRNDTDIWYKFIAETPFYRLRSGSFGRDDAQIQIFEGGCDQLELVYCEDLFSRHFGGGTGNFYHPFEIGEEYYIRISTSAMRTLSINPFLLILSESGGSYHNYCTGALFITTISNQSSCKSFSEFNTSTDYTIELPSCWDTSQVYDSWYDFIAKDEKYVLSTATGNLAVYSGECENLTLIDCGNEILLDSLELDQTYFIRTVGSGEFCLSPYATNSSCYDGIDIVPADFANSLNYSMQNAELFVQACNTIDVNDIWFTFTANSTSVVYHPVYIQSDDYTLALFEGSCDDLELIDCYENVGYYYYRIDNLIIGQEYIFRYSSTSSNPITFKLLSVPANELFDAALNIEADTCLRGNMEFVRADTSSYNGEPYNFWKGLWYEFTPIEDVYTFQIRNEGDARINIYKVGEAGRIEQIYTFSKAWTSNSSRTNINFIPGNRYYIQVWAEEDYFSLCLDAFEPPSNYTRFTAQELLIDSTNNCAYFPFSNMVSHLWENDTLSCVPDSDFASLWYYFRTEESSVQFSSPSVLGAIFQLFEVETLNDSILDCPVSEGQVASFFGSYDGIVVSDLDPEKIYLIRFHIGNSDFIDFFATSFSFCLGYPPTNSNDDFMDALEIDVMPPFGCIIPENSFHSANNGPTDSNLFGSVCDTTRLLNNDVWFSFVATDTILGFYFYPYAQGFSTIYYELYAWENDELYCSQFENINLFSHNSTSTTFNNLVIGKRYYLRFPQISGPELLFQLDFCVYELPPPPTNNEMADAITLIPSENLTECNSTHTYLLNMSDNSVWFKFIAADTSHQLVSQTLDIPFDATLYEFDSDGNLIDSSFHFVLETVITPPYFNNNSAWISTDSVNLGFYNFNNLEIGSEYHVKLGIYQSHPDAELINEDLVPLEYQVCLKTLPSPPINNSFQNAREITTIVSDDIEEYGYATLSEVDFIHNPQAQLCVSPNQQTHYYYAEAWYQFDATQSAHTIFIEKQAMFSELVEELNNRPESGSIIFHNLNTYLTVYVEESGSGFTSIACDIPIDSFYTINNLLVDETYYIKVYFNCINYLTDLNFGIAVSDLIDEDNDDHFSDVDCDDTNPSVYPNAPEICDGLDNNCNDEIDEGLDYTTYYLDFDGDGFGNSDQPIEACSAPYGHVLNGEDCDDGNANINPDEEEIADNEIDEDCDGEILSATHELGITKISIYPNPTNGLLFLEIDDKLDFKIELFKIDGKRIFFIKNANTLDLHHLTHGAYILKIEDVKTGIFIVERIIKI